MLRTCNEMNKFMSHLNSYAIVAPYIVPPPPPHGSIWSIFILSTFEINNWNSKTQKDNSRGFLQVFKQNEGSISIRDRFINFKRLI